MKVPTCWWVWLACSLGSVSSSANSPPVSLLCFLFLSLLRVLHPFQSPSPATEISTGYSSTGSDTAAHYSVMLPSQEGCVSDGCKAKESVIRSLESGTAVGVWERKASVVHLPPLLGPPHPLDPLFWSSRLLCAFQLRVSCVLITVSRVQLKLKIMYTISMFIIHYCVLITGWAVL